MTSNMKNSVKPTSRQKMKKESTYLYFLEKVDPILGDCITHLLLEQPIDIPRAMINFFSKKSDPVNPKEESKPTKAKKELKLYLATNIGPIMAKLVNRLAVLQPENVVDFMITELESMLVEDALIPDHPVSSGVAETKVPAEVPPEPTPKSLQIVVVGVSGAGKSTIVNMLQGKFDSKMKPTIGFRPSTLMFDENVMVRLYDLGGGKKIRDIWDQYFHDVHGIIYVIDASLPVDSMEETISVMESTLNNKFLKGKPLLVFANKQDLPSAISSAEIEKLLPIPGEYKATLSIVESSSFVPEEVDENFSCDPRIESSIETLCKTVLAHYGELQHRVDNDSKLKAEEEARKRIERERKVLRSKIASAFVSVLEPAIVEAHHVEADVANIFTEEEGLTFLAAEIGEEVGMLPAIAKTVAAMTGYQRLALQIVGALKAPISKKKVPMNWEEIFTLISELRQELNLPSTV